VTRLRAGDAPAITEMASPESAFAWLWHSRHPTTWKQVTELLLPERQNLSRPDAQSIGSRWAV